MFIFVLSTFILSFKLISFTCFLLALYSYQWFRIENHSVDENLLKDLCTSYGAFCDQRDQMPLPRLIVILPSVLCGLSLLLELINCFLLCSKWRRVRTIFNFCLEHMSIALSCAITIHCFWVAAVYLRISIEIQIVNLNRMFYAFILATILTPIDCLCSIYRMINNCQYEKLRHSQPAISQSFNSRQISVC